MKCNELQHAMNYNEEQQISKKYNDSQIQSGLLIMNKISSAYYEHLLIVNITPWSQTSFNWVYITSSSRIINSHNMNIVVL